MVRAAALAFLLLAGCDKIDGADRRSVYADANAKIALEQLDTQRREIAELKREIDTNKRFLDAVYASLQEARGNHDSLLKTFNANVDKSNKRQVDQERDIDWLMSRNGVTRQQN